MLFHELNKCNTNVGLLAVCKCFPPKACLCVLRRREGATAAAAAAAPAPATHRRPTKAPRSSSLHFIILPCCNYRKLIYGNFYISRENNTTPSFDLNNTGINRHNSIYIIIVLKVGKTFGPPGTLCMKLFILSSVHLCHATVGLKFLSYVLWNSISISRTVPMGHDLHNYYK